MNENETRSVADPEHHDKQQRQRIGGSSDFSEKMESGRQKNRLEGLQKNDEFSLKHFPSLITTRICGQFGHIRVLLQQVAWTAPSDT